MAIKHYTNQVEVDFSFLQPKTENDRIYKHYNFYLFVLIFILIQSIFIYFNFIRYSFIYHYKMYVLYLREYL